MIFYLSYPIASIPPNDVDHWPDEIKSTLESAGAVWFDPGLFLCDAFGSAGLAALDRHAPITQPIAGLDGALFERVNAEILQALDRNRVNAVTYAWKNWYVLLRSRFLLADVSTPSIGNVGADIMLAHIAGAYIVGVTDSNVLDPVAVALCNVLVRPHELGAFLEVLAHGHHDFRVQGVGEPESAP